MGDYQEEMVRGEKSEGGWHPRGQVDVGRRRQSNPPPSVTRPPPVLPLFIPPSSCFSVWDGRSMLIHAFTRSHICIVILKFLGHVSKLFFLRNGKFYDIKQFCSKIVIFFIDFARLFVIWLGTFLEFWMMSELFSNCLLQSILNDGGTGFFEF